MTIKRIIFALMLLTIVGIIVGSLAGPDSSTPSSSNAGIQGDSSSSKGMDNDSFLACSHFRDVAGDASKGLLTNAELRGKLQEVYDDASIADRPVLQASQNMLADATSMKVRSLGHAVHRMDRACSATGN